MFSDSSNFLFACDRPQRENKLTIKFQTISPSPRGFRFRYCENYYFVGKNAYFLLWFKIKKSTLSRGISPKFVTSDGTHTRRLAPAQHSSEATSQRWRVIEDTVPNLTGPGIESQTSRVDSVAFIIFFEVCLYDGMVWHKKHKSMVQFSPKC